MPRSQGRHGRPRRRRPAVGRQPDRLRSSTSWSGPPRPSGRRSRIVAVSRPAPAAHAFADALDAVLGSDPSNGWSSGRSTARAGPRSRNVSCRGSTAQPRARSPRVPAGPHSGSVFWPERRTQAAMPPRSSLSASGASRPTLATCWGCWRCSAGPSSRWRCAGSSAGARTALRRRSLNSRPPDSSSLPTAGSGSRTT